MIAAIENAKCIQVWDTLFELSELSSAAKQNNQRHTEILASIAYRIWFKDGAINRGVERCYLSKISYAQNFEDVMLHRCLGHVSCGFYIDVGANDPVVDSVTKKFYDLGWRGINIEPVKAYFDKLEAARPRDINVQAVVSNRPGACRFFEIAGTGISTTEKDVSESHRERGFFSVEVDVETLTLASICKKHVDGPVHFLKIDVEGGTKTVLEGMDLTAIRPWIIVVEATKPMTQIEDFSEWEYLILSCDYEFIYADGLNRFYVASEHGALKEKFKYPPNIFDGFVLAATHNECTARQWGQTRISTLEQDIIALRQELAAQDTRACNAETELRQTAITLQSSQEAYTQASTRAATLAREKIGLQTSLALLGDQFKATQHRVAELESRCADLQTRLTEQTEQARFNHERAAHLQTILHRVAKSLSWRITAPLRGWGTRRGQKS